MTDVCGLTCRTTLFILITQQAETEFLNCLNNFVFKGNIVFTIKRTYKTYMIHQIEESGTIKFLFTFLFLFTFSSIPYLLHVSVPRKCFQLPLYNRGLISTQTNNYQLIGCQQHSLQMIYRVLSPPLFINHGS